MKSDLRGCEISGRRFSWMQDWAKKRVDGTGWATMGDVVESRIWGVGNKMRDGDLPEEVPDESDGSERDRRRALDLHSEGNEVPWTVVVDGWEEHEVAMSAPEVFASRDILRGRRE